MQSGGWPLKKIRDVCDSYGKFDVPIHFSETTIVSGPRGKDKKWMATTEACEAIQADYVPQFYTMLFGHPNVQAITGWDFSDEGAWQSAAAGWLRKDLSAKPVYHQRQALIKGEWWTRLEGPTDENGEFATRAFYGNHRIIATLPNGKQFTT